MVRDAWKTVTRPLVSVLTPSFNQARWLPDNLRSVAGQTYTRIEHVVMDGGSSDDSPEILERSSRPGLIWTTEADNGQSDAINRAFTASSGDIIGWLNSDDAYFARDVVERAVDVFEGDHDVGVVYGHAALVNGDGLVLHALWTPPFAATLLRAYNLICQPTVFVRRAALGRPLFVDTEFDYSMDRELLLHLAARTRFQRLDRILSIDRHHPARKSLTRLDLAAHDRALIAERYRVPRIASNRVLHRATTVLVRTAGLSLVRQLAAGSDLLALTIPPARVIARRQVAQLRRSMPAGDAIARGAA